MAVMVYKCPHCGAALEFDAEMQKMTCDYCKSEFTPEQALAGEQNAEPQDIREETPEDSEFFNGHIKAWHCPECGADIVADANTAATFCRFCGAPALIETNLTGDYRPVRLIPFKISKDEAKEAFLKWCHHGKITPKDFASEQQLEKITGMYVPFWLFDCQVEGMASGIGTRRRTWIHGDVQYTNTQYFRIRRRADLHFMKVPADGSKGMDNDMMDHLEPFDYTQLIEFQMPYLSGYMAEKYDESHEAVYPRVQERIDQYTYAQLRDTISEYQTVQMDGHKTIFRQSNAMYSMLPVWMLTYRYQGQNYLFAMNGQSGKVVGTPPKDPKRILMRSGVLGLIVYVLLVLIGGFLL